MPTHHGFTRAEQAAHLLPPIPVEAGFRPPFPFPVTRRRCLLKALMDKGGSMQSQKGNISRKLEISRKNQKEMLKVKNTNRNMPLIGLLVDWT